MIMPLALIESFQENMTSGTSILTVNFSLPGTEIQYNFTYDCYRIILFKALKWINALVLNEL